MDDKNYSRLAQFNAFIHDCDSTMETLDCIKEIFKPDGNINYQIPALEFLKLENPEIIGCTALHLALKDQKTDSFKYLLNRGADYTIRSDKGMTVLHQAIEKSHNRWKECWKLKGRLTHPQASLVLSAHVKYNNLANPCDNEGMSHFHIACMLNHFEAVQFFLDGGVSPNKAIKKTSTRLPGYTPLHIGARYCCFETAQLLLQYGADKHLKDTKNMTPLHLLVERRIEIMDHKHLDQRAAFEFFHHEINQNERIVKLFIDDNDTQDYAGLTGFQVACTLQDTALVEKLLERHVDLDQSVSEDSPVWPGYTALHFSSHCHFEIVRLLLSHDANILAKDAKGVTPFDLCLERHRAEDILVVLTRVMSQMNTGDIQFSNGTTKLTDFVRAMKSISTFIDFLALQTDANMFLPHNSPLWPGYTPLHLALIFPERRVFGMKELYETSDYVEEECSNNYYNCDEAEDALFEKRMIRLLQRGSDMTVPDTRGSTPIHVAFPRKSENTFHCLLSSQRKVLNPVDRNGLSHLHIACAAYNQSFVQRILPFFSNSVDDRIKSGFEYSIIINRYEKTIRRVSVNAGSTLMHIAVATCDFAIIEMLLQHNANLLVRDSFSITPIHLILRSTELILQTESWMTRTEYSWFERLLLRMNNFTDCVTDFGLSHLHVASYVNKASAINKLLNAGASIERRINLGDGQNESLTFLIPFDSYTPLQIAMSKEKDLACEVLMKRGAEIPDSAVLLRKILKKNSRCRSVFVLIVKTNANMQKRIFENYGLTMLHLACIDNNVDWVAELLSNGADPNAVTNSNFDKWSGCSPLHIMVHLLNKYEFECKIMELLMNHGADIMLTNSVGNTPVHEAFHVNHYEECGYFELMLKHPKDCSVNPINAKRVSHFHAACISDNASIVEEFLKHDVDVNLKIDYFPWSCGGFTPLHLAVYQNYVDTIDLLLKHGADVNATDHLGNTPFHTAARHSLNFENLFDRLVSAGADVHARTLMGSTVLEELTWIPSNSAQIELLTKYGYRVNSFNPLTQQGLIGLSLCRDTDDLSLNAFYESVIKASDDSDLDDMGRTPLHNIVSCHGFKTSLEAIGEFLQIGYNIDHQDKQGRTALHCASYFCNHDGIIGLLEYGADINITDCNGQTAFTHFLERSNSEKGNWRRQDIENIVKIFVKHIFKLNFFGFRVELLNSNVYDKMLQKFILEERFSRECQSDLEKAKRKTIDLLSISLFDFLSSETRVIAVYPNMPLQQRQAIDAVFEIDQHVLRENFPQLSCLLRLQYAKALARRNLVESAKYSLNIHIGFKMPDLCSDIIFVFLTNQDLKNLVCSTDEYCQQR